MERKLAAILCADVYGYSRLMGEDEEATLRTLTSHRKLIDSAIDQHNEKDCIRSALVEDGRVLAEKQREHFGYNPLN